MGTEELEEKDTNTDSTFMEAVNPKVGVFPNAGVKSGTEAAPATSSMDANSAFLQAVTMEAHKTALRRQLADIEDAERANANLAEEPASKSARTEA